MIYQALNKYLTEWFPRAVLVIVYSVHLNKRKKEKEKKDKNKKGKIKLRKEERKKQERKKQKRKGENSCGMAKKS